MICEIKRGDCWACRAPRRLVKVIRSMQRGKNFASGKEENVIHRQASAPSLPAGSCRGSGLFSSAALAREYFSAAFGGEIFWVGGLASSKNSFIRGTPLAPTELSGCCWLPSPNPPKGQWHFETSKVLQGCVREAFFWVAGSIIDRMICIKGVTGFFGRQSSQQL